jgi:hypothetical protein
VGSERTTIAKNFADGVVKKIQEIHGINVKFDDKFYEKVSKIFFSHEKGIRQMKVPTVTGLANIIGKELISLYEKPELIPDTTLVIDLEETSVKDIKSGTSERKVQLKLTAQAPGLPDRIITSDLTAQAPDKEVVNKKEKLRTSIHEGGHAIANDPMRSGFFTNSITNQKNGNSLGHVEALGVPGFSQTLTRDMAIERIAMAYAGGMAEEIYFPNEPVGSGRISDMEYARKTAQQVVDSGIGLEGPHLSPAQAAREIESVLKAGEERSRQLLKERWPAVRAVAAHLMAKGSLDKGEFESIVRATGMKIKDGVIERGSVKPYVTRTKCAPNYFGSLFSNF